MDYRLHPTDWICQNEWESNDNVKFYCVCMLKKLFLVEKKWKVFMYPNERVRLVDLFEYDFFLKLFFETIIILNYSYNWLNWIYLTLSLLSPFTTSWNGIRMDRNAAMGERIDCGTGIWAHWRNRNCIKYFLVYVYDSANAI